MTPDHSSFQAHFPLLDLLRKRNVLSDQDLEGIQNEALTTEAELEKHLVEKRLATEEDILLALAEHARIPVISLANYAVREELIDELPRDMLVRNRMLPVARTETTLTLAVADPLNLMAVEEVGIFTQMQVIPVAVRESDLTDSLQQSDRTSEDELDDILRRANDSAGVELTGDQEEDMDIDQMLESAEDMPVVRIVNMILVESMHRRASDIHIEPFEREVRLRYRVDGVLQEGPAPPKSLQSAIISRLKVMASLDIAERRIPQDGRFRIKAQGKEIDLRVSMLPTVHGEKVVLRLLDKSNLSSDLDSLGLDAVSLKQLRDAITAPHGLILVTGPTGSGKTTTLYSALQELNNPDVNIITVENPVEYQLKGINQVEINPATGLTFAAALRSILRQDPDIVLVGETRDSETANIAVQAALTGHLVMTTLHTNDAPGAIARLAYMGVEPFMISSSVRLSQAQRLVRRICNNCKETFEMSPEYIDANHLPHDIFDQGEVFHGRGCSRCNNTGYKGRASIMEVLPITPGLRDVILRTTNADDIRRTALDEGFRDLRSSGWQRVLEGITTIEEVLRVTSA
ncbi:MAG: GspE/PulE family protein [Verrucomicrobiota bacterium]